MGIHDNKCELVIMAWILLIRLQVVRREGWETQITERAIMACEVCDVPLAKAFSLITKVYFLEMTIFAFSRSWLAEVGKIASRSEDEKAGLFCY